MLRGTGPALRQGCSSGLERGGPLSSLSLGANFSSHLHLITQPSVITSPRLLLHTTYEVSTGRTAANIPASPAMCKTRESREEAMAPQLCNGQHLGRRPRVWTARA